jgi:hypothetical protein
MWNQPPKESKMNLQDCAVGTEFWTAYGNVNGKDVTSSVHRWRLVSPEHKVGILVTPAGDLTTHSRVMESNDRLFATEHEAWQDVADQLSAVVEKLQAVVETCRQKGLPMNEAA